MTSLAAGSIKHHALCLCYPRFKHLDIDKLVKSQFFRFAVIPAGPVPDSIR
jgi:hypothetical protein